ncbi:MAG: glucose-6-phosphate isomerase family protein [bacterium]|nr:glucose-6-phosphate isomerase family protein [bacterium]
MTPDIKSAYGKITYRKLSDLKTYFSDQKAVEEILKKSDPILYEVYENEVPKEEEHLTFATTILYPGKVGNEFYFTKGHFHFEPDGAEVTIGIQGTGMVLLQNRENQVKSEPLKPFSVAYSSPGWAHRVVNNSTEKLVFLSICRADVGHDYETIIKKGFGLPNR